MADMDSILIQAGKKAYVHIRENGLNPDMVKIVAGAAGGPKWLVLRYLDHALFAEFFRNRKDPLHLVGSSSGAWRLAAISLQNGNQKNRAAEKFESGYIHQVYKTRPSAETVTCVSQGILDGFLDEKAVSGLLDHPYIRMNIMAVKSMGAAASDKKIIQGTGLSAAYLMNAMNRRWIGYHFKRVLFYDPRTLPPFINMNDFPLLSVPLTRENLKPALLASGSIPLVMSGVKDISGAPKGVYRDGGVIDYHLDLPYLGDDDDGLVIYPHYAGKIIPGWFDKKITWRGPSPKHMENVVLLSPSEPFVNTLPYQKIPDREDFYLFKDKDKERISYWKQVALESRRLGDAFMESVQTGKIKEMVRPL